VIVTADPKRHEVTITGDLGSEITMTWSAAANLASLLNEASRKAEPPVRPGRTYRPATERAR
jgi:hypothetical protein